MNTSTRTIKTSPGHYGLEILENSFPQIDKMNEEWRDIPGHPNYQASSEGRIRRKRDLRILKVYLFKSRNGKEYFKIHLGDKNRNLRVHRLILLTFVGPPTFEKAQGGHKNDDGLDNRKENLEWVTHSKNQSDKYNPVCGQENCPDRLADHEPESGQCYVKGCMCSGWEWPKKRKKAP